MGQMFHAGFFKSCWLQDLVEKKKFVKCLTHSTQVMKKFLKQVDLYETLWIVGKQNDSGKSRDLYFKSRTLLGPKIDR